MRNFYRQVRTEICNIWLFFPGGLRAMTDGEGFLHNLGETFQKAFNAPNSLGVWLTSDGQVWRDRIGESIEKIDESHADRAAEVMRIIASLDSKLKNTECIGEFEAQVTLIGLVVNILLCTKGGFSPFMDAPALYIRKNTLQVLSDYEFEPPNEQLRESIRESIYPYLLRHKKQPVQSKAAYFCHPLGRCDTKIADALLAFADEYDSTPSYSLTSKTYPLWSLVQKHIDPAVKDYLRKTRKSNLFPAGFSSAAKSNLKEMEDSLRATIRTTKVFYSLPDFLHEDRLPQDFVETMESLLFLVEFLSTPGCERKQNIGLIIDPELGESRRTLRYKVDKRHYPYCELCWRLSAFSQAVEEKRPASLSIKQKNQEGGEEGQGKKLSLRLCSVHDSHEKKYNNDIREYKDNFHKKIMEYKRVLHYSFGFDRDQDQDIRRFAYNFVRIRLSDKCIM
ncbi:hypothetical protein [Candidatus Methylospira mobilis]|nr:hypothetical protein [Candidatus Methylospira mobilis]